MLAYPLLQHSQQLTRTMGRTVPGQWALGLHGSSNTSVIFSRALHTPQALSLTLFPCGIVWAVSCCGGFSQVHGSSSQWEWQESSRAASGIVQSTWELKEQSASLRYFLGPQSPSSSLQFCLRTDSAASEKSATSKITDERGKQDFPLYYWKSLETVPIFSIMGEKKSLQVYDSLHLQCCGVKMLFEEALSPFWRLEMCMPIWNGSSCAMCLWEDHCNVSCCSVCTRSIQTLDLHPTW